MTVLSWILLFSRRGKNGCPQEATRLVSSRTRETGWFNISVKSGPSVDLIFPRLNDWNRWNRIVSRAKRPLSSIILDGGVKELLLEDARDFLKSKQWYADRGTSLTSPLTSSNASPRHPFPPRLPPVWSSWLWEDFHHSQSCWRART